MPPALAASLPENWSTVYFEPVTAQTTSEPIPNTWDKMKPEERYFIGQACFPSAYIFTCSISAAGDYLIEIKVKNTENETCTLQYVPKEGRIEINKREKIVLIPLGSKYASQKPLPLRRDLYEDLFGCLGQIFKQVESIRTKGECQLRSVKMTDKINLVKGMDASSLYLPEINLSFDDRYYQSAMHSKSDPLMISDVPSIKIDFNARSGLVWRRARLLINEREYSAARGEFSQVVVKPTMDSATFDVDYAMYLLLISVNQKLPFGEHHIIFEAENAYGGVFSKEVFARVITMPTQIIGKTMVYPNPFNPGQGETQIQYQLSLPANIDVMVFKVDGSLALKRSIMAGEEGGRRGYNKVPWDGRVEGGSIASNGIYLGAIIDRDENRMLDKFRITVFR